jgi:hypothetical protein
MPDRAIRCPVVRRGFSLFGTIPKHNRATRPDPPLSRTTGRDLPQRTVGARHDQLTNAALAAWFGACRYTESNKESPDVPGLFFTCRRQLFENALMAGLARRAFRRGLRQ